MEPLSLRYRSEGRKDIRLESLADNNHVTITLELVSTTGVIRGAHKGNNINVTYFDTTSKMNEINNQQAHKNNIFT